MRNRWISYTVVFLMAMAVVVTCIIAPGKLLHHKQNSFIGKVTAVEDLSSKNTDKLSNTHKQDSIEELYQKVRILTPGNAYEKNPREPGENEMNMKDAIIEAEKQLAQLVSKGVLPMEILEHTDYNVSAQLGSIRNLDSGFMFSLWNINYLSNSDKSGKNGSLYITLDAVTGKIYSIQWFSKNMKYDFNHLNAGTAFAKYLNIEAKPVKVSPKGDYASLSSPDNKFIIIVNSIKPSESGIKLSVEAIGTGSKSDLRK